MFNRRFTGLEVKGESSDSADAGDLVWSHDHANVCLLRLYTCLKGNSGYSQSYVASSIYFLDWPQSSWPASVPV